MKRKSENYDVYLLDMAADDSGNGYVENNRIQIGSVQIPVEDNGDMSDVAMLKALKRARFVDILGRVYHPLDTRNRRKVYAEDYFGDGQWWEVGSVKGHCPIFGLAPAS